MENYVTERDPVNCLVKVMVLQSAGSLARPTCSLRVGVKGGKGIGTREDASVAAMGPRLNLMTMPLPHPTTGARVNAPTTF